MNYRLVGNQLSLLLIVVSAILAAVAGWSLAEWKLGADQADERLAGAALIISAGSGIVLGVVSWLLTRGAPKHLGRREALLLVALSWFVGAALAATPFHVWTWLVGAELADHPFRNFVDCYFESMSGLTTTGATILTDIESVPRSLLLWRALTHWLGGLGIVVLFVAVLPSLGTSGKRLFRVEAPGPEQEGVRPQIRDTARTLWLIYLGFTAAAILAFRATGDMDWFDSVCHAFSVISTGGLSTRDASLGYYDSVTVDIVAIVFMLIAGVNFALFFKMTQGRFRAAWRDTELRLYLALKIAVVVLVSINLYGHEIVTTVGTLVEPTIGSVVRYSAFTTVALHTGTGFCTVDYDLWPFFSRVLLVGLMFIGGCAGSTAGGVKVIRVWIAAKVLGGELERAFRPNVIRPLRLGRGTVDADQRLSAIVYIALMALLFAAGTLLIALCEPIGGRCDFLTAMSASLSTLSNVGPGLHEVGATKNYAWFTDGSKIVMSFLMALGRLEVFAILVLLFPRFWRGD